jgi:hypothetical protein
MDAEPGGRLGLRQHSSVSQPVMTRAESVMKGEIGLCVGQSAQFVIPFALERIRDETVTGIDQHKSPLREIRFDLGARSTARRRSRSASSCRASISFRISKASSTAAGVILTLINSPMASSTGAPAIDWQFGSPREPCARSQTYQASSLSRRAAYWTLRYLPQRPHTARPAIVPCPLAAATHARLRILGHWSRES